MPRRSVPQNRTVGAEMSQALTSRRKPTEMNDSTEAQIDLQPKPPLLDELRGLILGTRERVARTVNRELVMLYWAIGRRIRQDVLAAGRAKYGEEIVSYTVETIK